MALIGCGTQGLRELAGLLAVPQIQLIAVCDPNQASSDYVDWSKDGLRESIAAALGQPNWRRGEAGIPGGREVAREVVTLYYGRGKHLGKSRGCRSYADFRELLDREQGLDAVKIMTPDHLHATIAIAAMNRGKHVLLHKPVANRLQESRWVIETARRAKVATHFLPASSGEQVLVVAKWIQDGAIGKLREIHNWSNRPVWPQYETLPVDRPAVPKGLDWDLWLGPSMPRPYHPHYTHAVFRGWYEFGGGSLADMGHYSLWQVFKAFNLEAPTVVESAASHACILKDQVSTRIKNDYSYPAACNIRFRFAAQPDRPALDLFWYDGGMKPPTPEELEGEGHELPAEGLMFIGDQGKILAGFRCEDPRIIPESKARAFWGGSRPNAPSTELQARLEAVRNPDWVGAFRGGEPTDGNFLMAGPISDAFNLGAISLRLGGKRLCWDAAHLRITNLPEANRYLAREYRRGWELKG